MSILDYLEEPETYKKNKLKTAFIFALLDGIIWAIEIIIIAIGLYIIANITIPQIIKTYCPTQIPEQKINIKNTT